MRKVESVCDRVERRFRGILIALVFSKHPIHAEHLNAYGTRSEVSFQIWQKSAKVKTGCAKVKTGGAQALRTRCLSLVRRCQS